jgi:hypothetical protein
MSEKYNYQGRKFSVIVKLPKNWQKWQNFNDKTS